MILTLEELCYRSLDLPIHKEWYSDVLHQIKIRKLHEELLKVFANAGTIMQNSLGYLGYKFTITKHLYIKNKVINLIYQSMDVNNQQDAAAVRKMMTEHIENDSI